VESSINFAVATTIVVGTELSIWWNKIGSVDSCSSAGQLISLALGMAAFLRVLYVYVCKRWGKGNSGTESISEPQLDAPTAANTLPGRGMGIHDRSMRLHYDAVPGDMEGASLIKNAQQDIYEFGRAA
jgi:hypothetical protein